MDQRPQSKSGLIPAKLFEHECLYLNKLPKHLPAPYQTHLRGTDVYGYVTFCANYYWVPGTKRETVKLLEYADHVKIFLEHGHECLAEYALPAEGVKNQRFTPPGKTVPPFQPRRFRKEARLEEQRLRSLDSSVSEYLDFALRAPGMSQKHRFTRELFALSRKITLAVFLQAIQRAHRYRILDLSTIRRIAWYCISQQEPIDLPDADIDDEFQQRPAYQEGCLTEEPNLSIYDELFEESEDDEEPPMAMTND
jgi:hypothetical protein